MKAEDLIIGRSYYLKPDTNIWKLVVIENKLNNHFVFYKIEKDKDENQYWAYSKNKDRPNGYFREENIKFLIEIPFE